MRGHGEADFVVDRRPQVAQRAVRLGARRSSATPAAHHAAMSLRRGLLRRAAGAERDGFDWVPESSRRARGFAVWPRSGRWADPGSSTSSSATARSPAGWPSASGRGPRVAILNEVVLNQVLVRFEGLTGDRRRPETPARATSSTPSSATARARWAGRPGRGTAAMRVSVSGWHTTEDDIDRSAAAILACLAEVDGAG